MDRFRPMYPKDALLPSGRSSATCDQGGQSDICEFRFSFAEIVAEVTSPSRQLGSFNFVWSILLQVIEIEYVAEMEIISAQALKDAGI